MPSPLVLDVANADDVRDVVHHAVQALAEGQIVGLPTETVYGVAASATHPEAVVRLAEAKGRPENAPFALAVTRAEDAEDYAPGWGPLARRLARRCWPGPVTLVVGADHSEGLTGRLPAETRRLLCPEDTVALRAPANAITLEVLRMLAGPVALTGAKAAGGDEATDAAGCSAALGENLALVLDDGPARYGGASTGVRVDGDELSVVRDGVVGRQTIERMSRVLVVFVCTGNTCRSPMAEAVMRSECASAAARSTITPPSR